MYGVIRRQVETVLGDAQERLMLSVDKLFSRETGTALKELHSFWLAKSPGGGEPPCITDFDYKAALSAETLRFISWVDVTAADPYNYVIRDHTNQTSFSDHTDRRLGDHPSRMNLRSCAFEYRACMADPQPFYHEIEQTIGNISRHYRRMMLPIVSASGRVERLVYAVRIVSDLTTSPAS